MSDIFPTERDRITIAILALGGQGGGVLADWILDLANENGFVAQGTSVPGVAQRTGSTVYYIEMVRRSASRANRPDPVLAMMPVPGDVDIVIASELMEAGRAILRGFVSDDRTTLIGSTHRIYAISEKSALGDGTGASQRILDAAGRRSKRFIGFDMDAAASTAGSVISSIMFGALAGSGALPFSRDAFEAAITRGGKAVPANLRGLATGIAHAETVQADDVVTAAVPEPTTAAGRALRERIGATLPSAVQPIAIKGVRRLMDYQDRDYADLYLDRLSVVHAVDSGASDWCLTSETARHLALWMAYEDTIRVADLKVRATRSARVEREVGLKSDQVISVTEYMHPRLQEVCETLPSWVGRTILGSPLLRRLLRPLFAKGRHVTTTSLRWFVVLRLLAGMRGMRRSTSRFADEQSRIGHWLDLIVAAARRNAELATEVVRTQELIKGYSDTFERGLERFQTIAGAVPALLDAPDAAERVRNLRAAALADEDGKALDAALAA